MTAADCPQRDRAAARPRRFRPAVVGALAIVLGAAGCGGASRSSGPATSVPQPPGSSTTTTRQPTTTTSACTNVSALESWSVARLAAQTVVVPVAETDVASVTHDVAGGAGGVILFGTSAPSDLAAELAALRAAAPGGIAPFVMTDEEGGAVQRMANLVGQVPSAREMGATMTPPEIEAVARQLAQRLRAAGVDMDLAPVLDVDGGQGPNDRDPDGTRSFSGDEAVASRDGLAFAAGLAAGGVTAVVKHFPGLGGATGNTDVVAAATPPWSELQRVGLVPFADAAAHVPAVMVANATVPGLTSLPASISRATITGLLRSGIGYKGLVLTDSLSAVALSSIGYSVPRAAAAALGAGADMFLYDASAGSAIAPETVSRIVAAVRTRQVTRSRLVDAVAHILAVKRVDLCAPAG